MVGLSLSNSNVEVTPLNVCRIFTSIYFSKCQKKKSKNSCSTSRIHINYHNRGHRTLWPTIYELGSSKVGCVAEGQHLRKKRRTSFSLVWRIWKSASKNAHYEMDFQRTLIYRLVNYSRAWSNFRIYKENIARGA